MEKEKEITFNPSERIGFPSPKSRKRKNNSNSMIYIYLKQIFYTYKYTYYDKKNKKQLDENSVNFTKCEMRE